MTIADFLYQASFWQWAGLIILAHALVPDIKIPKHSKDDKK